MRPNTSSTRSGQYDVDDNMIVARIPAGAHRCGRGFGPCNLIAERTSTGGRYRCLTCSCIAAVKVIPASEQEFTPEIPASQGAIIQ